MSKSGISLGLLGSPLLLGHLLLLLPLLLLAWLAAWALVGGGFFRWGRDLACSSERWVELRLVVEHVVQAVRKTLN